ncbi:MAG: DUF2931 family protein [Flavobacterium sp.]|nr:MAG: DUF2931 family protein [Flavobacterium sp.]
MRRSGNSVGESRYTYVEELVMMKNYVFSICFLFFFVSCDKSKKPENKTNFSYDISITAPEEYPVEIHTGYLSSGKKFITDIINTGEEKQGWIYDGNTQSGGSTIPDFLDLTWISYAEKKFWNLETPLPADKILALFRKGFIYKNSKDSITTETYGQIVIGTAPGGVVVVWLDGSVKRVEVGRYQAVETFVDKNRFQPVVDTTETQEQFLETWYKLAITNETKEEIKKHGIPFGLWDSYRKKYNWRFRTEFYKKDDKDKFQNITFFNGEFIVLYEEELGKKEFSLRAVPIRAEFVFRKYNSGVEFNEKEIFDAFKKLSTNHPDAAIEIEVRPAFMYKTLQFTVKCEGEEIPLEKTEVNMYKN